MPHSEHSVGMLLVNFWVSSIVNCVCKHLHISFFAHSTGQPLSPLTIRVALMPLSLVSTQMPLISLVTCSAKLPFFISVIVIIDLTHNMQGTEGVYARD